MAWQRRLEDLAAIQDAFVRGALAAQQIGADGVEIHACHGYLLDLFLWPGTNRRTDGYGGDDIRERVRFPAEIVAAVRKAVGADFVISFRFSQWKEVDYDARIAPTPRDLETMLSVLRASGVDVFHASARRFWIPEWPGSDLGIAGWTKSLTDAPVIAVGSVGLDTDVMENFFGKEAQSTGDAGFQELLRRFENNEFDLVSVGRGHIGDPDWVKKVADGRYSDIRLFTKKDVLATWKSRVSWKRRIAATRACKPHPHSRLVRGRNVARLDQPLTVCANEFIHFPSGGSHARGCLRAGGGEYGHPVSLQTRVILVEKLQVAVCDHVVHGWPFLSTLGFIFRGALPKIVDHLLERLPSLDRIGAAAELSVRREYGGISIGIFCVESANVLPH